MRAQRGQAAVETALTLPMSVFIALGIIQLFMMQQARIMTNVAAFRATRAGSVFYGDCLRMSHAALGVLIPTFHTFARPTLDGAGISDAYVDAFERRNDNLYDPTVDRAGAPLDGPIVWVRRLSPVLGDLTGTGRFDLPDQGFTLTTQLLFWYPLRIPFVNWVIARIALVQWDISTALTGADPIMPVRADNFTGVQTVFDDSGALDDMRNRVINRGQYIIPIRTTYSMRMMTPPRAKHFGGPLCPIPLPVPTRLID